MHIVVVGGGTGTNAIAPVFHQNAYRISYVVPISDNGGSTSEILRLFGGPAIGDARSRIVKLMERSPLRNLLAMRLPDNAELAERDWFMLVQGTHAAWDDIPSYMKCIYRPFLVHVHAEILKRSMSRSFNFSRASVGNLFLTGARLFFGSLEAALELVLHTARVSDTISVLPCINTNFSYHIAARLHNGTVVVGQTEISHPSLDPPPGVVDPSNATQTDEEDGSVPFAHPNLSSSQIDFDKGSNVSLPSPIQRVYYVNPYGDEIRPAASPRVLTNLFGADAIVLSVGSLYTSILPVLILREFGSNMPSRCVLILNGSKDRETESMDPGQYIDAVNDACVYSGGGGNVGNHAAGDHAAGSGRRRFVSHVIYPDRGFSHGGLESLKRHDVVAMPASCVGGEYLLDSLSEALQACLPDQSHYVVGLNELSNDMRGANDARN